MKSKNLISMIIVLLMFFCGQLIAEEVVGYSIYTNIETPHPYPKVEGYKTPVWSITIGEPGSAWIKIHFSRFSLAKDDYVEVVNGDGRIIERISAADVIDRNILKFKVKRNEDQTVDFWASALDGEKVEVKLYCTSYKQTTGFIIDEVGIGNKSLYDSGMGPIYNIDDDREDSEFYHFTKRQSVNSLNQFFDVSGLPSVGRLLYKRGHLWYTCKGYMVGVNNDQIQPDAPLYDNHEIIDTLEVHSYISESVRGRRFTAYINRLGDQFYYDYFSSEGPGPILKLKNIKKMVIVQSPNEFPQYVETFDFSFCICLEWGPWGFCISYNCPSCSLTCSCD